MGQDWMTREEQRLRDHPEFAHPARKTYREWDNNAPSLNKYCL